MAKANFQNRTIFGKDNLYILQGIYSKSIDLIYLDPPFNKKKTFHAPIGSSAAGASFKDIFTKEDLKEEWLKTIKEDKDDLYSFLTGIQNHGNSYNFCYLAYMAIRLIECKRILKDTGSLYLHCDPTMSHYLKIVLDCIFEEKNFMNELVWHYKNASRGKKQLAKAHDIVLWYSKDRGRVFFDRESILIPFESGMTLWRYTKGGQAGKPMPQGKTPDDVITLPALNTMDKERTGYPTQKPLALLERIIKASCPENGLVLDPFCGCATTCVAAEKLGRKWAGIDISIKAYELVKERLAKEVWHEEAGGQTQIESLLKQIHFTTEAPKRSGEDEREKKFVYILSNPKNKGQYKVGIASNMKSRLNGYQTGDPDRGFKLEYKKHTHLFRETEKHIHEHFNAFFEWVQADKEAIKKEIEKYIKSQPDLL